MVLRDEKARISNIESAIAKTSASAQEILAAFGDNTQLLLAMVAQLSDSMSAPLTEGSKADPIQCLLDFGKHVIDIYTNSHLRGVYRIAVTESIRHTDLGSEFYKVGPGRLTQRLAEFFQVAQANGTLRRADPHLLASHFLSLLRANLADKFLHDLATNPGTSGAYIRDLVDLFCRGTKGGRKPC